MSRPSERPAWPPGDGEMAQLIRAYDWAATPLGPVERWPQSLKVATRLLLTSRHPMFIWWGPELIQLYNDAYRETMGPEKHSSALGRAGQETWAEIWDIIGPQIEQVLAGGEATWHEDQLVPVTRHGGRQDVWWTYSFSPIDDEGALNGVGGVLVICRDVTREYLTGQALREGEARQALLLRLSDTIRTITSPTDIQQTAMRLLSEHLGLSRAYYFAVERESDGWVHVIDSAYQREPDGPSMVGRHALNRFGERVFEGFARGEVVAVADVGALDMLTSEELASYRGLGLTAFVNVPLLRNGGYSAGIGAHDARPHTWTQDEIDLIREVAARTWTAVEHARAEVALRESRARLAVELADMRQLHQISSRLIVDDDVDALYAAILDVARSLMRSEMASIQRLVPERQQLFLLAQHGFAPASAEFWAWVAADSTTSCGVAFAYGDPLVVPDVEVWDLVAGTEDLEHYRLSRIRAMLSTPLISRNGHLVGMMSTHWRDVHEPSERELHLLDVLARQAADLIERRAADAALRESEERLRQFGEASQDILWIRDAQTLQWVYLTLAFETIYGLSREDALAGDNYRSWQDLIVPEDRDRAVAAIARVRAGEYATFEYRVRRPSDGAIRWLRNTDFPITNGAGEVVLVGGIGHDATGLRLVEQRLRALMEGIPQLVWRAVDGGWRTWSSPQWSAYTGQAEAESLGKGWLDAVHPHDRGGVEEAWAQAEARGMLDLEYRIRNAAQRCYRWFQSRATPVRDAGGAILEWLGTSTDVDDLRRLQEEQAVLVTELQHRTRNLIAVVRSIAGETLCSSNTLSGFRDQFNDRLAALSRVQGLLSRSDREPITLGALLRMELDALGAEAAVGSRLSLDGPEVGLRKSMVQTLALALHELATNARKYGALASEGGRLHVTWQVRELDGQGQRLVLDWVEEGSPVPDGQDAPVVSIGGYGRQLIEQALPYALDARTSYVLDDAGVRCTIDLPLAAGDAEQGRGGHG